MNSSFGPLSAVMSRVRAWPVDSQLAARRNAMVATTALAARRAEREDVEAFLASVRPRPRTVPRTGPVAVER